MFRPHMLTLKKRKKVPHPKPYYHPIPASPLPLIVPSATRQAFLVEKSAVLCNNVVYCGCLCATETKSRTS